MTLSNNRCCLLTQKYFTYFFCDVLTYILVSSIYATAFILLMASGLYNLKVDSLDESLLVAGIIILGTIIVFIYFIRSPVYQYWSNENDWPNSPAYKLIAVLFIFTYVVVFGLIMTLISRRDSWRKCQHLCSPEKYLLSMKGLMILTLIFEGAITLIWLPYGMFIKHANENNENDENNNSSFFLSGKGYFYWSVVSSHAVGQWIFLDVIMLSLWESLSPTLYFTAFGIFAFNLLMNFVWILVGLISTCYKGIRPNRNPIITSVYFMLVYIGFGGVIKLILFIGDGITFAHVVIKNKSIQEIFYIRYAQVQVYGFLTLVGIIIIIGCVIVIPFIYNCMTYCCKATKRDMEVIRSEAEAEIAGYQRQELN